MTLDAQRARDADYKAKIFISYSRKDMAFVDRLDPALKARGFEALIDRDEIYAFEPWWERVQKLIGQADTVVFVLSPDSVDSEVALKEVEYAASLNKRFAPIVCRPVVEHTVPEALRRLNFIFFDDPVRFNESVNKLSEALQTDIVWLRDHTKFGEAARGWAEAGRPNGLLLRTPALEMAEYWIASRPHDAPEPPESVRAFVLASRQAARSAQRIKRSVTVAMFALLVGIIMGLVGWIEQDVIKEQWRWYTISIPFRSKNFLSYALNVSTERTLTSKATFRECAGDMVDKDYCPLMVVVPAGSFIMGSPSTERGHRSDEEPSHNVTIAAPFAVSVAEVTFWEWDTCVEYGNCPPGAWDMGWGRADRPAMNVNFEDAQRYVSWLSRMTGKPYRLLTEAEWEYAARGGTTTAYPWGDEVGKNNANCASCLDGIGINSGWPGTAPVGSFAPNGFGLYDMIGNVWEWVFDCYHDNYRDVPTNGTAWTSDDCFFRVARGGAFNRPPEFSRSATRHGFKVDSRIDVLGFRVARTLKQ
jgi:formylglycine-generating enzyme required for sulfatase activity